MDHMKSAFLVVGQSGIVLQDIMAVLGDAYPGWRGLSAPSMDAACALIDGASVGVAFVTAAPRDFNGSTLAARLALTGARVVLMGNAAEECGTAGPYPVLQRPFASDDIVMIATA